MKTILISGKAGSGKDQLANFLKEELSNKRVIIIHYGDPVKYFAKQYYNWNGEKDEAGRHLLQHLATDLVRSVIPDYWTDIVIDFLHVMEVYNQFDVAIIADVRFPNEAEIPFSRLKDVVSVRIERKDENGNSWVSPKLTKDQAAHPSETSLDYYAFDYIVHNDEGLELLKESAKTLLKDIKGELDD